MPKPSSHLSFAALDATLLFLELFLRLPEQQRLDFFQVLALLVQFLVLSQNYFAHFLHEVGHVDNFNNRTVCLVAPELEVRLTVTFVSVDVDELSVPDGTTEAQSVAWV